MPTNVRSPEGNLVSVPDDQVAIWQSRGYAPVGDAERAGEEAGAAVLDDFRNPVGAFVGSAVSGATLGLSDYLLGDRTTELEREASPYLSTAGQIAGAVVPSLLTGGSAAVGTGAKAAAGIAKYTPAGAVANLGAKVTAMGAQGGRIAKVGAMAAGAGIEGSLQMAGQYMAETAIQDKPLTAEGFMGAMGKGALFGAGIGGAMGIVAQGASSARKLFAKSEVTEEAARRASAEAAQRVTKATAAGDEGVMVTRRRLAEIRLEDAAADAAAKQAEREYAVVAAQHRARAAQASADLAERQAREAAERGAPLTPAEIRAQTAQRMGDVKVKGAEQAALRKAAEFDAKMAAREKALELQLKAKGATDAQKLKTQKALDKVRVERAKAGTKGRKASAELAPSAEVVDSTTPIGMVDDMPPVGAANDIAPPIASAAEEAALPTLEDYVDDAIAKVNPEAAGIVQAARQYKKARAGMTRITTGEELATAGKRKPTTTRATDSGFEWKVTAPQGQGGHMWISSEDLAQSTIGRIRQAFKGASDDQRAYVESLMTPKRVEAVRKIESGEARHMPGWFNRDHHFEGFEFDVKKLAESDDIAATRQKVWGVRSQLDNYNQDPAYFRTQDSGKLHSFADETPFVDQHGDVYDAETLHLIGVIGDFDKSTQALARALGDNAPPSLADEVAELMEQAAKSEDGDIAAIAAHLDDTAGKRAIDDAADIARGSDQNIKPPDDMMPPSSGAANANAPAGAAPSQPAAAARMMDPDKAVANAMLPEAAAKESSGLLGYAADAGAALEAIQMLGGTIPGVPRINEIPLIGPLLSTVLKARAAWGIFKRVGGKIPASVEGNVASKAAATRDRIRAAADKLMRGVETGAEAVGRVTVPASATLERVLYSSGATVSKGGGLPARLQELAIAANDPQGVERRIRENVPSADAELVAQIVEVAKRKLSFLQDKAPKDPRPPSIISAPFMPSTAHTATFARYVRAADEPATVFEDAADGILTTEGVETLKAVYPRLYQEAQTVLMERADTFKATLPYARRLLLGTLFDVPIDGTMTPEYRSAMAAASQAGGPQPGNAPQQGVAPSIAGSAAKVASMADPNSNRRRGEF